MRPYPAALALGFVAAWIPIVGVAMPPIMDFPNHLARIWLIAGGARQAPLDAIYGIDLAKAGANVGVDLAAAALAQILPIFAVSKLLVALAFLLPPLGGALLNRPLSGRWHVWQLTFLGLAWSTTAIAGFVNFQISLGLALLGAALAADRLAPPRVSFALHAIVATMLAFAHPLGLAFYGATIFALLVGPTPAGLFARERIGAVARGLASLLGGAAVSVLAISLLFKSEARAPWPFWGDARNIVDPVHILTILLSPVLSYRLSADLLAAAPVAALIAYALFRGLLTAHAGLTTVAAALFFLAPLAPDAIGDGSWLPQRFPIMAALLFLAGLRPRASPPVWSQAILFVAVMGRILWIGAVWMGRQGDIADLTDAMRALPPGAALITLQQEPSDWRRAPVGRFMIGSPNGVRATGRHLGALAVIEARAFVPTLFSVPGQQALVVAPGWRDYAVTASSIPYPRQLGTAIPGDPYLKEWRAHFQYVLVLNADLPSASDFAPAARAQLTPVAGTGFARLYRVN